MLSLSAIRIDQAGWTPIAGQPCAWQNRTGDLFSLHFFAVPPDIPCALANLEPLRRLHREMLAGKGAVVEVETDEVDRLPAVRTIVKMAQRPSGMTYLGGFTFPFRDCSFMLKYECPELGVTGIRDAVVLEKLGPALALDDSKWFRDPYEPTFRTLPLRNRSDDEEWDTLFPEHPLSRIRAHLQQARRTTFDASVREEPPFSGPPRQ